MRCFLLLPHNAIHEFEDFGPTEGSALNQGRKPWQGQDMTWELQHPHGWETEKWDDKPGSHINTWRGQVKTSSIIGRTGLSVMGSLISLQNMQLCFTAELKYRMLQGIPVILAAYRSIEKHTGLRDRHFVGLRNTRQKVFGFKSTTVSPRMSDMISRIKLTLTNVIRIRSHLFSFNEMKFPVTQFG